MPKVLNPPQNFFGGIINKFLLGQKKVLKRKQLFFGVNYVLLAKLFLRSSEVCSGQNKVLGVKSKVFSNQNIFFWEKIFSGITCFQVKKSVGGKQDFIGQI